MPSNFPLHAVLQVRQRREEAEERALTLALQTMRQAEAAIAQVEAALLEKAAQRARSTAAQPAAWFQAEAAHLDALRQQREQLRAHLAQRQQQAHEQQKRYLAAHVEREMLTALYEKHEKETRLRQASLEQKRLDAIITARWPQHRS